MKKYIIEIDTDNQEFIKKFRAELSNKEKIIIVPPIIKIHEIETEELCE